MAGAPANVVCHAGAGAPLCLDGAIWRRAGACTARAQAPGAGRAPAAPTRAPARRSLGLWLK